MCLAIPARVTDDRRRPHGHGRHHGSHSQGLARPRPGSRRWATSSSCTPASPSRSSTRSSRTRRSRLLKTAPLLRRRGRNGRHRSKGPRPYGSLGIPRPRDRQGSDRGYQRDRRPAAGQDHGGVRHAHRLDRQERPAGRHAREGHPALRPRLPGLRHRQRGHRHRHRARQAARRHRHHLRRHDEGPRQLLVARQREGRRPRRPHRLLPARRPRTGRQGARQAGRLRRRRLRDHRPAHRRRHPARQGSRASRTSRCSAAHKTVPAALGALVNDPEVKIDAFILPGHVSTIIGSEPYQFLAEEYHVPGVITGFEPVDVLQGVYMLLKQLDEGRAEIEIAYHRGVMPEGNPHARATGRAGLRADRRRLARNRRDPRDRPGDPRGVRRTTTPPSASPSPRPSPRRSRAASAARCCAASPCPSSAGSSAAAARPSTPSDRAWSPRKARCAAYYRFTDYGKA